MINKQIDDQRFPFYLLAATAVQADVRTPVIERSNYEAFILEYIVSGSGYLEIDGHKFRPAQGSIYILHRNSTHQYWPDRTDPWHKIFFVVSGAMVDYLFASYHLEDCYYISDAKILFSFFESMRDLNYNSEHVHRRAAVIFHQLLEEAYRLVYGVKHDIPYKFEALKDELDNHLEHRFEINKYCSNHEISAPYMIRGFRNYYGVTPYEYLMKKRLELAMRLLNYSSFSVKEIAARLCFSDQYYFSNYFKQKNGVSPTRYRNQH